MAQPSVLRSRYREVYEAAASDTEGFWRSAAENIHWETPFERVFDSTLGVYGRWFPGGTCNACYNTVDRHVEQGRGDQAALIYDSPVTQTKATLTYRQLLVEVVALASTLRDLGVRAGDRVIIYMPMVPEAVVGMLACARLGAVHSVVFGGFAAKELATRIDDARPKVVLAASCGIEPSRIVAYKPLLDEAISLAKHKPSRCLVLQRPQLVCALVETRDVDYRSTVEAAKQEGTAVECVPMLSTDPLYILYTSGTTGQPKGVVRDHGGYLVALAWTMENEFGIKPGEVFWTASDVGWVVGHSYIVYGPLLNGSTTVLYEGKPVGTPDAGAFWRVISEYGVVSLFTAPTAFRVIKGQDPRGDLLRKYDVGSMRALFLAGERADPETINWAKRHLQVPVVDHWWQTETGIPITHNPVGLGMMPERIGSPGVPMPGFTMAVLDDDGHPLGQGKLGNVVIQLPLPPGCLPTLWNADDRFRKTYLDEYPGYYKTADAGYIDDDGYLFIMARTDDIINVAGHRLSTGGMEEVVARHPDVAECAVVGIADRIKGQVPLGLFVLSAGVDRPHADIEKEVVALVRNGIGPVAAFRSATVVKRLPKTRSGKILRGTIQKIADGQAWTMPATIEDPAAIDEIAETLGERGLVRPKLGDVTHG